MQPPSGPDPDLILVFTPVHDGILTLPRSHATVPARSASHPNSTATLPSSPGPRLNRSRTRAVSQQIDCHMAHVSSHGPDFSRHGNAQTELTASRDENRPRCHSEQRKGLGFKLLRIFPSILARGLRALDNCAWGPCSSLHR